MWRNVAKVDHKDKIEPSKAAPRESVIERLRTLTVEVGRGEVRPRSHFPGSQVVPWWDSTELENLWLKSPTSRRRNLRRPEKEERPSSRPCTEVPSL